MKKSKIKKNSFYILFFYLLTLFFSAAHAKNEQTIRIGTVPFPNMYPIFIEKEQKLFDKENIKAEFTTLNSSNDAVNALIADKVDIVVPVSVIPVLHLAKQQPDILRIFSVTLIRPESNLDGIFALKKSKIDNLSDLSGKKIGVFPGTTAPNMIKHLFKERNINIDKIVFVPLASNIQIASLESKAIDALYSYDPVTATLLTKPEKYKEVFGSVLAGLINPSAISSYIISRKFEKQHPELAQKALEVFDAAIIHVREHPSDFRLFYAKATKTPKSITERVNIPDVKLSTEMNANVDNLQNFINLLQKVGELDRNVDAKQLTAEISGKNE